MATSKHYVKYNEIIFKAYTMTCIDKAIAQGRRKKLARGKWEQSLSSMLDTALNTYGNNDPEIERMEMEPVVFEVKEFRAHVRNSKLGQAISFLLPKNRDIIILYYFVGMADDEVARCMHISTATANRRRKAAEKSLLELMEDIP